MTVTRFEGPPLVGRQAGLAEMDRLLDRARQSGGGLVLITGPAGMGKTRLAEEACARAAGFGLLWCWCATPAEGSLHPWRQIARTLAANNAAVSRVLSRSPYLSGRGSVEVITPGLFGEEGHWSTTSRQQLFDDVAEIVEVAGAAGPFLIVADDVHAAGTLSLQLLTHVAPILRTTPMIILGTARDEDGAWQVPGDVRGTLVRLAHRVSLGPLRDVDVRELMHKLGVASVSDVVPVISRRTGGNPLLVTEMVRLLDAGAEAMALAVPPSVQAIVVERTADFAAPCRDLLAVAAVLGTYFRLDVLAESGGVALGDVRGLLADAERGGVVAIAEPGVGHFTHELLRDALYEALPPTERAGLHERAASVLAVLAERGRGVEAAEVAHHLVRAGPEMASRAADFAMRAGAEAQRVLAYDDAVRWYEQAAECLDLSDADAARRSELLLALGEARLGCGDREGARSEFLRAASTARAGDEPALFARAALGLGAGLAGFEVDVLNREQIDLLTEARDRLPQHEGSLRALVTARLSVALTMLESTQQRCQLADDAVKLARDAGDGRALVYALSALCDAQAGPEHCQDRLRYTNEMVPLAVAMHDAALELLARRLRLVALLEVGDIAGVDAEIVAFRIRSEEMRHPLYSWYVPLWRATRALMEGRLAECDAANTEAESLGRRAGSNNAFLLCITQRWCLFAEQEDRAGIEALMTGIDDALTDALWMQVGLSLIAAQLGHLDDARRRLDAVAPRLTTLPRDSEWLAVLAQVAETVRLTGGHPIATWVYDALLPFADRYVIEGIGAAVRGPVHRHLGLLAAASGNPQVARDHFAAAVTMSHAIGATLIVARIEEEAARLPTGTAVTGNDDNVFRIDGELWLLRFNGQQVLLRDAKGLHDLAVLVAVPRREVAALDLAGVPSGSDTGAILDRAARDNYQRRLIELAQDADEAESMGDRGRAEQIAIERDALVDQLTSAFGLGGRARRSGSPAERARTTVTARIRDTIRRIERVHPELGRHLDRSIRTGTFCTYHPDPMTTWKV